MTRYLPNLVAAVAAVFIFTASFSAVVTVPAQPAFAASAELA